MTNEEIWKLVLNEMELSLSKANFITWFKDTKITSINGDAVIINVPNGFVKEWLQNKFNKQIFQILKNVIPELKTIDYVIGSSVKQQDIEKVFEQKPPVLENNIDHDQDIDEETNLNKKYNFDNFVVGPHNELAYAASIAIIKDLGKVYNPLFIYGGVGLGKTHLLQAIANKVIQSYQNISVLYIPSEKMVSEIIEAIRAKKIEELKLKYTKNDVLVIDDVQFLAGKETTQDIFFATFNYLYNKNKQIVLSSDRPPKAIPAIEERLRSRFEGGMIADIGIPDYETRVAILKLKLKNIEFSLEDEIIEYIATNIQKNIRELEGALNRIVAICDLTGKRVNIKDAEKILKAYLQTSYRRTSTQNVIKTVADFYGITINDLTKKSRKQEVVKPRQIAMYLLREDSRSSFPEIGMKLGGRDHSTVIHAYNKISKLINNDENLRQEIVLIRERLYNQ